MNKVRPHPASDAGTAGEHSDGEDSSEESGDESESDSRRRRYNFRYEFTSLNRDRHTLWRYSIWKKWNGG